MSTVLHTIHVVLAGIWLGGVVFTTMVVSPALKQIKWSEAERVAVRSTIGRQYARVAGVSLVLLLVFALLDGTFGGFGADLYAEYALLAVLFGLTALHGVYFGPRLVELAEAEKRAQSAESARAHAERRRRLQERSLRVSWLNILISTAVMVLAVGA